MIVPEQLLPMACSTPVVALKRRTMYPPGAPPSRYALAVQLTVTLWPLTVPVGRFPDPSVFAFAVAPPDATTRQPAAAPPGNPMATAATMAIVSRKHRNANSAES